MKAIFLVEPRTETEVVKSECKCSKHRILGILEKRLVLWLIIENSMINDWGVFDQFPGSFIHLLIESSYP